MPSIRDIVESYNPSSPLAETSTIPAAWYVRPELLRLEQRSVFTRSWHWIGRADQVREPGQYVATDVAGQPLIAVRGDDGQLRAFYNVCRHHAALIVHQPEGRTRILRCPYHGWTYSLRGELKITPDFSRVRNFDRAANGLVAVQVDVWENWVFVKIDPGGPSLTEFLGSELVSQFHKLRLNKLHWFERRHYSLDCNWKVFVDNYLDGGYHVPLLHRELNSVLEYGRYTVENGERFCLQSSPITTEKAANRVGRVRKGERVRYYWIYPNFMVNLSEGVMDTNIVYPVEVDRTEIIFDFYFADVSEKARARNLASIDASHQIQEEDASICTSVQRGLASRAYRTGRLSSREAGEHLFHRLLYADLKNGLDHPPDDPGEKADVTG